MNNEILAKNLKFLFSILKKERGITKSKFLKDLNIVRSSLHRWEHGQKISKKNLDAIVDYFNRELNLDLNSQSLLFDDLKTKMVANKLTFREPYNHYLYSSLNHNEQLLLKNFRLLDRESQEIIIKLVKKLKK